MGSPMGTPGFAGSGGMAGPEMMSPAVMPPGGFYKGAPSTEGMANPGQLAPPPGGMGRSFPGQISSPGGGNVGGIGMGSPGAPGQQTNWKSPGGYGGGTSVAEPIGAGLPGVISAPGLGGGGGDMMYSAVMPPAGQQTNWKSPGGTVGMQMPPSNGFSDYSNAQPMPMPSPGMGGGMRPGMGGGLFSNLMARFGR